MEEHSKHSFKNWQSNSSTKKSILLQASGDAKLLSDAALRVINHDKFDDWCWQAWTIYNNVIDLILEYEFLCILPIQQVEKQMKKKNSDYIELHQPLM